MARSEAGFLPEYRELLVDLLRKDDFPTDMNCVAAARRTGFDPDDVWRDVSEICTMRDDEDYDAKVGQLRSIAKSLRAKK